MNKYTKISLGIFLSGLLLTFIKFWYHWYPVYVMWWTSPFFEQLYYVLLFVGMFSFLAFYLYGLFKESQSYQITDRRKLFVSFMVLLCGFLSLYTSLWHKTHSFLRYEMWWQGEPFQTIYQIMFIGGFSATVVMLLKMIVYKIRDYSRQRKTSQTIDQQG